MAEICKLPEWQHLILIFLIMLIESWVGKTQMLKSSSILELLTIGVFKSVKTLFNKEKDNGKSI